MEIFLIVWSLLYFITAITLVTQDIIEIIRTKKEVE